MYPSITSKFETENKKISLSVLEQFHFSQKQGVQSHLCQNQREGKILWQQNVFDFQKSSIIEEQFTPSIRTG